MKNARTNVDVVRAWKDPAYRATLSCEELAGIPESPVGMSELDPQKLAEVFGGIGKYTWWFSGCRISNAEGAECPCAPKAARRTSFKSVFR